MKRKQILWISLFLILLSTNTYSESITVWYYWSLGLSEQLKIVTENYEKQSGIEVKLREVPMSALNTRFVMVVGEGKGDGEGPDLILGVADWIGQFNAKEELLSPINEYVSEEMTLEFFPNILEGCLVGEKIYGLPINYNLLALIYNKKYVEKVPETMNELIDISKKTMKNNEDMYGLVYNNSNYYFHWPFVEGFGISPLNKDKQPTFNSKQQKEAFRYVRALQEEHKIIPRDLNEEMSLAMFQEGLAAFLIIGPWEMENLVESGVDFGVANIPLIDETNRWPKPIVGPDIMMLSKKSKKKKLAIDYMKYLIDDAAQMQLFTSGQMLPVKRKILENEKIKNSKIYSAVKGFINQAHYATPMPRDPELNIGVWYYGAPTLSEILNNSNSDIDELAEKVQEKALKDLEEYHKTK